MQHDVPQMSAALVTIAARRLLGCMWAVREVLHGGMVYSSANKMVALLTRTGAGNNLSAETRADTISVSSN